ncbi:NADH-quinone oxidoreductase subunit C [Dietzia maris]|uniref:NADH-quinone oxidoreductase subunit C n=1 Tax=Dietzia maris TaxID=37915 RepID=A0AAE4QXT8_9ACTN|nr:NADH-quinone oxidoreductase subunit C [Dietzia maris]MDV6299432.1 NADH-quinone oxidoreductase subunit C [Dietzia maris]
MTDRRPASGAADRDRAPDAPNPPDRTNSPGPDTVGVRHGMFGVRGSGDTTGFGGLVRPKEMPGGTPPPYEDDDDEVIRALTAALHQRGGPSFQEAVERVVVHCGQLTLHVERQHLPAVALTLRDAPDLRFEMSLGASGVHYPDASGRELHVVYPLQSITHNRRVMLETSAPDADPHIPTLTRVYPTTDWHERETYDFFGVIFDGHPSLTRIEMPDDWEGHPQRKDYPLGGIPVQYKGATIPPPDQRRAYS